MNHNIITDSAVACAAATTDNEANVHRLRLSDEVIGLTYDNDMPVTHDIVITRLRLRSAAASSPQRYRKGDHSVRDLRFARRARTALEWGARTSSEPERGSASTSSSRSSSARRRSTSDTPSAKGGPSTTPMSVYSSNISSRYDGLGSCGTSAAPSPHAATGDLSPQCGDLSPQCGVTQHQGCCPPQCGGLSPQCGDPAPQSGGSQHRGCCPPQSGAFSAQCADVRHQGVGGIAPQSGVSAPTTFVAGRRRQPARTRRPRYIDLFGGGGGASIGFSRTMDCVAFVEYDRVAADVYMANHPHAVPVVKDIGTCGHDILGVLRSLGDVDLVHLSPPCQPFSSAGRRDPNDPRIQLTFDGLGLAVKLQPMVITMENVPNLLQHLGGTTWSTCLGILTGAGYDVHFEVVDAAHFVPQRRERLFVVATRKGMLSSFSSEAAQLRQRPKRVLREFFPDMHYDSIFLPARRSYSRSLHSMNGQSPTLRTNCYASPGRRYTERTADSPLRFIDSLIPTVKDLKVIMGWPTWASLPPSGSAAGKVLGNSVCPAVAEWLGFVITSDLDQHRLRRVADDVVANLRSAPSSSDPQGTAYAQAVVDAAEVAVTGAHSAPLPGSANPQVIDADRRVPDTACNTGADHVEQLRRRERRRLATLLRTRVRTDGSLRSLRDPVWTRPPVGVPPCSSNPPAMFGARPWTRHVDASEPTHRCRVSQRWRRWRAMHMAHCQRCQRYSAREHGCCPPVEQLRCAFEGNGIPDETTWTCDPSCYQAGMVEDIRVGLDPPTQPPPPSRAHANGSSLWEHWDSTVDYMVKMEKVGGSGCLGPHEWQMADGGVCSAMHAVVRPSDLRAHQRDGVPLPVRTVIDLTASGVNDSMPHWRFRLEGIDAAIRLLGRLDNPHIGCCDLSKYFPSLPVAKAVQHLMYIRDPRVDTTWRGPGEPSKAWLRHRKRQRRSKRRGPFRVHDGLPLGLRLSPPFACALSGEMVQFLTAIGIDCCMYVDDLLVAASGRSACASAMRRAMAVFEWLGFSVSKGKTTGPARRLKYLGYVIDIDARTVTIGDERRRDALACLRRLRQDSVVVKDLESTIGRLGFIAGVVPGGRTYTCRLYRDLHDALQRGDRHIRLSAGALKDVDWWQEALSSCHGGSRIFGADAILPVVPMKSDAAGEIGWGYVLGGRVYFSRWQPRTVTAKHIQYKELVAVVHASEAHGQHFRGSILRTGVDNAAVAFAINRQSSHCPTMMTLLRRLADAQRAHDFTVIASHVPRKYNDLADLATRFQVLAEWQSHLPEELAVNTVISPCTTPSPADGANVYSFKFDAPSRLESNPPLPTRTASTSSSTSTSALNITSTPRSDTSPSLPSRSTTSPAPATPNFDPTKPSTSTSPPGLTTRTSTTALTSPSRTLSSATGSIASSPPSASASRTSPSATPRSCSTSSSTSASTTTYVRPLTSSSSTAPSSSSGPGSSLRTTPACGPASTPRGSVAPTSSTTASASSPFAWDTGAANASTSRAPVAAPSSTSVSLTSPLATSFASSSAGCTGASRVASTMIEFSSRSRPAAASSTNRLRHGHGGVASATFKHCATRASAPVFPERGGSRVARFALAARRTTSPQAAPRPGSSCKAAGPPTPTRSTTGRLRPSAAPWLPSTTTRSCSSSRRSAASVARCTPSRSLCSWGGVASLHDRAVYVGPGLLTSA